MGIFQKWPLEENVEFSLIGTKISSSHVTMQELCGSESDVKKLTDLSAVWAQSLFYCYVGCSEAVS